MELECKKIELILYFLYLTIDYGKLFISEIRRRH